MENTVDPLVFRLLASRRGPEHAVEIQNNGVFTPRIGGLSRAATREFCKWLLGLSRRVFQLHWVDVETEVVDLPLAGEVHGAANGHHAVGWRHAAARSTGRDGCVGHDVRLRAKIVRPFVSGNKNDTHDARAIWTAVQQPGVKTVAVKSEEQQAVLALHRMRQQLVKFRTAQINGLRGLLTEYGEVMPQGRAGMRRDMAGVLERVSERLPAIVVETGEQWARVAQLDAEVATIEERLRVWHRQNAASRRIGAIPGVGVLSATAAVATMGDPAAFKSGREFAAWLGLVPRHSGTGGRVRMLGISKRGDTYLRTLLIHGTRSDSPMQRRRRHGSFGWRSAARPMSSPWRSQTRQRGRSGPCWPMVGITTRTSPGSPPERGHEQEHEARTAAGGRPKVAQGTRRCDGKQVRPRSAKPESAARGKPFRRNEARVG